MQIISAYQYDIYLYQYFPAWKRGLHLLASQAVKTKHQGILPPQEMTGIFAHNRLISTCTTSPLGKHHSILEIYDLRTCLGLTSHI